MRRPPTPVVRRGHRVPAVLLAMVLVTGTVFSGCSLLPTAAPSAPASPASGARDDPTTLVPPILETGDVPAPAPATTPITGQLTLGATTSLAAQTIGTAGGTITAAGLRIQVPAGALAGDTRFDVKQAPITGQIFGGVITPLTPLYRVDDGEAAFAEPVTVTLPASVPAGATAMAFSYDAATGRLTPLIPIAQDATSLTVGATHFSDLFGALIDLAKIPTTVESGFRPGIDDWQFGNYGSYVAPEGQCEGHSVSAMWYYVNQRVKASQKPLFGLYDNNGQSTKTPSFQWDDSQPYRLVSSVQVDPIANPFTYQFLKDAMFGSADGRLTYNAFRAAIALSGEPQLIAIRTADMSTGHAMVVYRVTPDLLYVADPNYSARLRTIPYDAATGKLGPYSSGATAADIALNGATVYTRLAYVPWRAAVSEAAIAAHWAELKAGTAGDAAFPDYVLQALASVDAAGTETWVPLVDGYRSVQKQLKIRLLRASAAVHDMTMLVYRGTSSAAIGAMHHTQAVELADGVNALGFRIDAKPTGGEWDYVDFVRLKVILGPTASPSPTAVMGQPVAVAVRMDIAGSFVRDTRLAGLKVKATGVRTFGKDPSETRIKDLAGEIAADGKSVTLTITYLDDPTAPSIAGCSNVTILRDIPLRSTDPTTKQQTFYVSGWDAIIATIQDSYPYFDRKRTALCMTTADWSFNRDANPNPMVTIIVGY